MSEPITTALRGLLCARPLGDPCWDAMDAVDAVHSALEAENAALRERVEELDNVGGSMHDGESITDELREYAEAYEGSATHASLDLIAERIDAEHEKAIQQALMDEGGVPATDENMAEHGWVRKDKEHIISHATIEVTPHIDWSRMADELNEFVEIVRGIAGGAK